MSQLPFYLADPTPAWYSRLPWECLDIETTNLEHGDPWIEANRVVLGAWVQDRPTAVTQAFPGEAFRAFMHCGDRGRILVAHNAKFELGWLYRSGVDISNCLVFDTMIAEYVLAGNRRWALDLDSVARRYGLPGKDPFIDALMKGGVCPSEMPRKRLEARCKRDVETTMAIARAQYKKLEAEGLLGVMFTRCIVTPVLALIEGEGMTLDAGRVEKELESQQLALVKCQRELAALTGGINLNSGKQLAEVIYGKLGFKEKTRRSGEPIRTAAGKPKTDSDTLAALRGTTKDQKAFVKLIGEHSKIQARISKALKFFDEVCKNHNGTFRARFNQCVTQTHRLSSSGRPIVCSDGKRRGTQFQNLAREYKKLFKASKPGNMVVETDGAQLEFRVAGHLGRDEQVMEDVRTGADIHRFTASVFHNCDERDVTDSQRTAAKAETFGPLYGRTTGTQKQLAYIEAFQNKYKGVNAAQNAWVAEALRTQELRTVTGLKFYYPGTKVRPDGSIVNRTSIYNYSIQSLATADIIPISLAYTFWATRGIARIVNTVHDSVVAEVPKEKLDGYIQIVRNCWLQETYRFLDLVYGIKMFVPLGIGIKAGEWWGTGEELKFSDTYKETI